MRGTALITGATSGIGKATAVAFAQKGLDLILCGRNTEALETLGQELGKKVRVHCLVFDVRDKSAVMKAIGEVPREMYPIDILVNNAGNAHGRDPVETADLEDWDAMVDINIKGLLYVSHVVIPDMVQRKQGHIIHIGSLAGKEVYPGGNVYCASKHAVDAINQGMRMDLHKYGIRVGAVNPGLVKTGFSEVRFKGDKEKAEEVYRGYAPLQAEDIAEIITFVISRPAHVNIADLLVLPTAQASSVHISKTETGIQ